MRPFPGNPSSPSTFTHYVSAILFCLFTLNFFLNELAAQTFHNASDLLPPSPNQGALGASLIDFNNDGLVDIYRRRQLLLQQQDGTMLDVFEATGITENAGSVPFGGLFGDYDGDGFLDLFFMDLTTPSKIFNSFAGMRFSQVNALTGLTGLQPVQGSVWGDFNKDGRLDLFAGIDGGGASRLMLNQEPQPFLDFTETAGFTNQAAYGVAASDYDRDGDLDILMTQCFPPSDSQTTENILYQNQNARFAKLNKDIGITDEMNSWGAVWLDYDNDGWMDFYVVNVNGTNTLYQNDGDGGFTDVSTAAGVTGDASNNNIAVSAADFDNDGWIDLITVDQSSDPRLYRNNGDGTFTDIFPDAGLEPIRSQALAVADINNDGWVDVFIPSLPDGLFYNEGGVNHYLKVAARGVNSTHFGVGARLDLYAGGLHQVREITAGDGFTSQNHNLSAHFGLGDATMVDSLVIRWPLGAVDRVFDIQTDQTITIVEGIGINNAPAPFALASPGRDGSVLVSNNEVHFTWDKAEDQEDTVTYTMYLQGADINAAFSDLADTTFSMDANRFIAGSTYRWSVSTTDGYSIRGTQYAEFTFPDFTSNEPELAEEPLLSLDVSAYPNPFASSLRLAYTLANPSQVSIIVFDVQGHEVYQFKDAIQSTGKHEVEWSGGTNAGRPAAPGLYFVRIMTENQASTQAVVRL